MASVARIDGQDFKRQDPWGVFALSAISFGIYFLVWYYRANDEARRYLRDELDPPRALRGGDLHPDRGVGIDIADRRAHRPDSASCGNGRTSEPGVALRLSFPTILSAFGAFLPFQAIYMQTHLNAAWDAASASTPRKAAALSRG